VAVSDVVLKSKRALRTIYYALPLSTWAAKSSFQKFSPPYKLNVGCGTSAHPGWINLDYSFSANADIRWDLTKSLPLAEGSCSRIYQESFLQMFTRVKGQALLREFYRLLAPGGVMRIAMPSLEEVFRLYTSGEWRNFDVREPGFRHYVQIRNGAQLVNCAFRDNIWLYDWEDLNCVLGESGFREISKASWGESRFPEFRTLETRPESKLICETVK
jgi:predicted SAM-dependent methyltransferase